MTTDVQQTTVQPRKLPEEASLVLWSDETVEVLERALREAGVEGEEQVAQLTALVFQLGEGGVAPAAFAGKLAAQFGLDETKARALAIAVFSGVLVGIAKHLPFDARTELMKMGGGGPALPDAPPVKLDAATFVKSYVVALPGDVEERYRHRIEAILDAYMGGMLARPQVIEKLQRPMKIDGLGLDAAGAENVLAAFDKEKEGKEFIATSPSSDSSPGRSGAAQEHTNDQKEVEDMAKAKAPIIEGPPPTDVPGVVAAVCDHEAFAFDDPLLRDRCAKIVESRVREVRDAGAARSQMERGVDKGGLGVTGRRLSDMLERMEAVVASYEEEHRKRQEADKAAAMQARVQEREVKAQAAQQQAKVDTAAIRAVIDGVKKETPPKAVVTPKIIAPSMQEIAFERRLAGPVDELARMSLADFRRLSRNPAEATVKIKDKIALLEEQGVEQKIAGVKAWRTSPLSVLYMGITHEALVLGKSVAAVIAARMEQKAESLTIDEYHAVAGLNSDLRF